MPLRAVSQAFNVAVDCDGVTKTIFLGEKEGKGVDIITQSLSWKGQNGAFSRE